MSCTVKLCCCEVLCCPASSIRPPGGGGQEATTTISSCSTRCSWFIYSLMVVLFSTSPAAESETELVAVAVPVPAQAASARSAREREMKDAEEFRQRCAADRAQRERAANARSSTTVAARLDNLQTRDAGRLTEVSTSPPAREQEQHATEDRLATMTR